MVFLDIIVHQKLAYPWKTRAPMIRYRSSQQLSLAVVTGPCKPLWMGRIARCTPWDELAEGHYQDLAVKQGCPAKDDHRVIGAVIIKHKLCLSDQKTVATTQENPYLPYFVGLSGYQRDAPFAPSLWVEVRKRMGSGVFEVFYGAIIAAVEKAKAKAKRKPAPGRRPKPGKDEVQQPTAITYQYQRSTIPGWSSRNGFSILLEISLKRSA